VIGHRLWPRPVLCYDGSPVHDFEGQDRCPSCGYDGVAPPQNVEVHWWHGLTSWLFGFDLERHPYEWTLWLRLGPLGLSIQRLR